MTVGTLLRYLIGNREAILTIASNRHSLGIGLLFVLSAAFAREYDGEDLLHEPWHLLVPFAASLASSLVLFCLAYGVAVAKGEPWQAFFSRYLSFLGLFWMTAPLAWLYAIPYERFLSPPQATALNLITLGVVSLWRVALMACVLHDLFGFTYKAAVALVILFADAVALSLLYWLPFPLIDVMGGLRLSEAEQLTRAVAGNVCLIGGCSLPLWLLLGVLVIWRSSAKWQGRPPTAEAPDGRLIALAVASLVVWALLLPLTQPEQVRRREAERAYAAGDLDEVLRTTSSHRETDYPPHWLPPGPRRQEFGHLSPDWLPLVEKLAGDDVAPWVRRRYVQRLRIELRSPWLRGEEVRPLALALARFPEGRALIEELKPNASSGEIVDALDGKAPKEKGKD